MNDRIPTNLRLLLMLETLGEQAEPISPSALGRRLGLPKQTAHRLVASLIEEGFLKRDEAGTGLRPGRRARMMAAGLLHASGVHVARHQVLLRLAERIGETINFVVPEDRGMAYHDRVETDWPFRIQLPVGSHVPFHCTASGKTYLATLPKAQRRRLVQAMALPKLSHNTITDPDALLAELQQIARQGYALDNEEFHAGMVATAVPVTDPAGRYFASVAFHAPTQRVSIERAVELAPVVASAAAELTAVLFPDP
ncbi:IclR family transcriptional regulator [Seohaeicola zhoushanensis]|uniref:IclR family transcriptional regulator n=1 Tax=Seohaeicola zhoushanensis TaxID=1569283 RepID=A0A8J3GX33_9RHOB|nr:IclR family transcriptional regulator [Seohaeicola zhoushanensis]GHF47037.1 IclR family transcriptional regulator [Seohaeicola zhoushanensis]